MSRSRPARAHLFVGVGKMVVTWCDDVGNDEMSEVYVFFRTMDGEVFFYPVELADDADAKANAECNPGTIKVENIAGKIVWSQPND